MNVSDKYVYDDMLGTMVLSLHACVCVCVLLYVCNSFVRVWRGVQRGIQVCMYMHMCVCV